MAAPRDRGPPVYVEVVDPVGSGFCVSQCGLCIHYISTQMQLRCPQLPSSAYGAALEQEIRRRGYSIESMLRAADAATTWDTDEAWDMVRAALERQCPKSSSSSLS
jgi:hypothetical protein